MQKIPSRLKKTPILESVFEIRYVSSQEISAIIPGLLHSRLSGIKKILPVPPIPVEIIISDPSMQSVSTFSMEWEKCVIFGNPHFVAISYRPPYENWDTFKNRIKEVHTILMDSKIFSKINRYSIKYVNFINENQQEPLMNFLNIAIDINGKRINEENFALHVEIPEDRYMHIIKVITNSTLQNQNIEETRPQKGLIIDTDTICLLDNPLSPDQFMAEHAQLIDAIHEKNKKLFFDTLSPCAIEYLEPDYD